MVWCVPCRNRIDSCDYHAPVPCECIEPKCERFRNLPLTVVFTLTTPSYHSSPTLVTPTYLISNHYRDGGARAHFYNPTKGEWVTWVNMLPQLQIPDEATMGDIVVPNAYTAQYNSLLTLLLNRDKKVGLLRRSKTRATSSPSIAITYSLASVTVRKTQECRS